MTSKRIEIIASLVQTDAKVLDIGTDHCFVPIFLYKNGITKKITALDINPNPLAIAKENLYNANMENKVALLLNDGLNNLNPNNFDVIIIAGLGGSTIAQIIDEKNFKGKLILHPTNNEFELRKILSKNNFLIHQEMIIIEKKISNLIIEAIFTTKNKNLTEAELLVGPKLINNSAKEVTKYYNNKAFFYQDLYKKSAKNEYLKKANEFEKTLLWRKNNLDLKN